MGYYEGQRENPCPRCGGPVATTFISVSPMSFSQRCRGCGAGEFTPEEETALGPNVEPSRNDPHAFAHRAMRMELTTAEAVSARLGGKP
jgi:hypothetical protein